MGLAFADVASAFIMLHEVGHNHGRQHAPCVPPGAQIAGVDPDYPQADGRIGTIGYEPGACRGLLSGGMNGPSLDTSLWLDLNEVDAANRMSAWRTWMEVSFPEFSLLSTAHPARGHARALSLGDARLGSFTSRRPCQCARHPPPAFGATPS